LHNFNYAETWSDSEVRRFVIKVGLKALDDLFALKRALIWAQSDIKVPLPLLDQFEKRIKKLVKQGFPLSLNDLAIKGDDIMALGVKAGPLLGQTLNKIFEAVIENPNLNSYSKLVNLAKTLPF
jgi:hypothetical protein